MSITALALPLTLLVGALLVALEHRFPAHDPEPETEWYVRAVVVNAMQLFVFTAVGRLWEGWDNRWSLQLMSSAAPFAGACVAYFVFTFAIYWWHRARHASPLLWRVFHQFHHSPKRIQALTAYYIHPLDMFVGLSISNVILFPLLGASVEAAAWYTLISGVAGFFIHANLRVPRAVGYVFQTPAMHRLHHKRGHHAQNYSDIVWWDVIFGTYSNPREEVQACGFDDVSERKVLPLLLGRELRR